MRVTDGRGQGEGSAFSVYVVIPCCRATPNLSVPVRRITESERVLLNFEEAFDQAEKSALVAVRAAVRLAAAARALARAAAEGDIGRIRKTGEKLSEEADTARQEAANACAAWPLSPEAEERYLREEYAEELLRSADTGGLKMQRHEGTLAAYPMVIRILPRERALTLNRKKVSGLRPSRLVVKLKAIQNRKTRDNPQAFLEALFSAYKLTAQGERAGLAVSLVEIFEIFTLLPGSDYSKEDFARDLLSLDRNGINLTKSGARVSLPASSGTRDSRDTFQCVTPEGEVVPFYGVKFTQDVTQDV